MNNIIAVTMGDPAGIGPEIIIKSLSEAGLAGAPVVVVGCVRTLRRIMAMNITPQAELRVIQKVCDAHFAPGVINVMDEPLANPDALTPGGTGCGRRFSVSLYQTCNGSGLIRRGESHSHCAAE